MANEIQCLAKELVTPWSVMVALETLETVKLVLYLLGTLKVAHEPLECVTPWTATLTHEILRSVAVAYEALGLVKVVYETLGCLKLAP